MHIQIHTNTDIHNRNMSVTQQQQPRHHNNHEQYKLTPSDLGIKSSMIANIPISSISWSDFKGQIPSHKKYYAHMNWHITYSYFIQSKQNKKSIKILPKAHISNKSWANPQHYHDTNLLQHQYTHYLIGCLCCLQFQEQVSLNSDKLILLLLKQSKKQLTQKLKQYFNRILKKYLKMEIQYDQETNHYYNRQKQRQWEEKIAKEINGYYFRNINKKNRDSSGNGNRNVSALARRNSVRSNRNNSVNSINSNINDSINNSNNISNSISNNSISKNNSINKNSRNNRSISIQHNTNNTNNSKDSRDTFMTNRCIPPSSSKQQKQNNMKQNNNTIKMYSQKSISILTNNDNNLNQQKQQQKQKYKIKMMKLQRQFNRNMLPPRIIKTRKNSQKLQTLVLPNIQPTLNVY